MVVATNDRRTVDDNMTIDSGAGSDDYVVSDYRVRTNADIVCNTGTFRD
jgi:hypothetical protein